MNTTTQNTEWGACIGKTADGKAYAFTVSDKKHGFMHPICESNYAKDHPFTPEEIDYNARLIEAAPKLLEMLKNAAHLLPTDYSNHETCIATSEEHYLYEEIETFVAKLEGRQPEI
jgi:hypothetical protein